MRKIKFVIRTIKSSQKLTQTRYFFRAINLLLVYELHRFSHSITVATRMKKKTRPLNFSHLPTSMTFASSQIAFPDAEKQ